MHKRKNDNTFYLIGRRNPKRPLYSTYFYLAAELFGWPGFYDGPECWACF